jgi:hypothetical protein
MPTLYSFNPTIAGQQAVHSETVIWMVIWVGAAISIGVAL